MAANVQGSDQGARRDSRDQDGGVPAQRGGTGTTRITVNIGPETERALRALMEREHITLTEAVRRLIGYGELLYRTIKLDGKDVLIRHDGETQQVLLV